MEGRVVGGGGHGAGCGSRKSESEKEKTKLRERRRRSITRNIFDGLRRHGGYNLPPRPDINDVLRALANEAGFVVDPDGTTYRAHTLSRSRSELRQVSPPSSLHLCSAVAAGGCSSGTSTPTSSLGGGGGDSSTTASPLPHPPPGGGGDDEPAFGGGAHFPGVLHGGLSAAVLPYRYDQANPLRSAVRLSDRIWMV